MEIIIRNDLVIDCRNVNTRNYKHSAIQAFFRNLFEKWIERDKQNNSVISSTYDMLDLYREGFQIPIGFEGDPLAEFKRRNSSNRAYKDEMNFIFWSNNLIKTLSDKMKGEYTSVEEEIIIQPDLLQPQWKNITIHIQKYLEHLKQNIAGVDEDDIEDLWIDYRIPCIEGLIDYGLYFSQIRHNPYRQGTMGAIEAEAISPREMLIDATANRKKYFKDANHKIRVHKKTVDYVKKLAKRYGFPESKVSPDNEYQEFQIKLDDTGNFDEYCTLYEIEFRVLYDYNFNVASYYGLEHIERKEDTEGFTATKEKFFYFKAYYYKPIGLLYYDVNPLSQFTFTEYINRMSALRFHPLADAEFWRIPQDIHNIYNSIELDNYRMNNSVRLIMAKMLVGEFGVDRVFKWIRSGGVLDIDFDKDEFKEVDFNKWIKQIDFEKIPGQASQIAERAERYLKEQGFFTKPAAGEYPTNDLSFKAIQQILQERKQSFSHKDINIAWAFTQETKLMYKIIGKYFNEEHFISTFDLNTKSNTYIPFNAVLDYNRYNDLLEQHNKTPEEFEKENLVKYTSLKTDNEELYKRSFRAFVNPIYEDDSLMIKVKLLFGENREKEKKLQMKLMLWQKGEYPTDMLLDDIGLSAEKAEILEKIKNQNQAKQVTEELMKRPEIIQQVLQLIQTYDKVKNNPELMQMLQMKEAA